MRIAQLVLIGVPDSSCAWSTSCLAASAARAASARQVIDGSRAPDPRLRAPALARPDPALPAREAGEGVLAAARRRGQLGRVARGRAAARAIGGSGPRRHALVRGPDRDRGLDRSGAELRRRSTSSTSSSRATWGAGRSRRSTSADAAVRGHRLFALGELDEIVLHPPIQRFLARWRPGDPTVYLGPLWAP